MARLVRKRRTQWSPAGVGIALMVLGGFAVLAVWQPGWTGWVGRSVLANGLTILLGGASYEVGVVLMGMGWLLLKRRCSVWAAMLGGVGLLAGLSTIVAVVTGHVGVAWQWPPSAQGGGMMGWALARVSTQLLGEVGTLLWAAALVIAVPIWAFPNAFRRFWQFLKAAPLPVPSRAAPVPAPKKAGRVLVSPSIPPATLPADDTVSVLPVGEPEGHGLDASLADPPSDTGAPRLAVLPDLDDYQFPPLGLLDPGGGSSIHSKENVALRQEQAVILEDTLSSFGVAAKVVNVTPGPSVTRYELAPGVGVKVAKITSLSKDIALKLAAPDVRIEAPIPGKALVGIEVPNRQTESVTLRALLEKTTFYSQSSRLVAGMGLTITGEPVLMDLAKMPHVLIAGATGSGKSVCVNTFILSVLLRAKPDEVKFLMIDPKKVELSLYEGIPHLVAPVVTDPNKAAATLNKWALVEMERRYETFSKVGVKHIEGYNQWVTEKGASFETDDTHVVHQTLPYIVVIIDELADLMMVASSEVESTICRLAQMSRATGIHLVIATQRPSVDVVTGLIKANVPSRISFFLQSQIDSRTILDMPGAEKLLGKGDMLYSPVGSMKPQRVQGVYVSEREVKAVVGFLKAQASPSYIEAVLSVEPLESESKSNESDQDELYEEAKQIIMNTQYASTSYLQRKLRIGYNRAARLMEALERQGVVSQYAQDRKKPLA